MTEELKQKAEEYAINMWGNDEAFIDERNNCKQDYIAGAIENGIQWHVLRKDPNDLPKDNSIKRCYVDDGKYYRLYFSNAKWHYSRGGYTFLQDIIAWCEEPQFKESMEELTLTATDIERKAIAFCREKEITLPIANLLVEFAEKVTKELQENK